MENRIEILEVSKDDTEQEIRAFDNVISEITLIKENTNNSSVRREIEFFIQKLKQEKEQNEVILQEVNESIEFVKNGNLV